MGWLLTYFKVNGRAGVFFFNICSQLFHTLFDKLSFYNRVKFHIFLGMGGGLGQEGGGENEQLSSITHQP